MMAAMTTYNPLAISLFTASWTAGMAAMMFPAIAPMVLLYNRFVSNGGANQNAIIVEYGAQRSFSAVRSFRVMLFVGSYLLVWALTGIALLLGWSVVMNNTIMTPNSSQLIPIVYGSLLIIAGAYQFTPLKRVCIGYCESPMSFFMRRWKGGTFGAMRMGLWHGMYCLGCCWAYFLLMVALGWMNLLWMGLFAGIIFGEKMWSRGIWVARAAGAGLTVAGILVIAGMLPSLVESSMGANNGSMGMDAVMSSNTNSPMGNSGQNSMTGESNGDSNDVSDHSVMPSMDSSDSEADNNNMKMDAAK
jgi:predicted metal-binding membrane protein